MAEPNVTVAKDAGYGLTMLIILGALFFADFGDDDGPHDLTDALICATYEFKECRE